MDLSESVLGQSAAKSLRERINGTILTIGQDRFTRRDLATVSCFNYVAARNLSEILNKELSVKNTRDVFTRIPPLAVALPRLGVVALAVLGAAFEAKGVGGDHPLEAWMSRHAERDSKHPVTTFDTVKHKVRDMSAADRKALKAERAAEKRSVHTSLKKDADTILDDAKRSASA